MELLKQLAYREDSDSSLDFNYQNGWCVNEKMLMETFLQHTDQREVSEHGASARTLLAEEFGILPHHVNLHTHLPWLCQNYLRWIAKKHLGAKTYFQPVILFMTIPEESPTSTDSEAIGERMDLVTAYHRGYVQSQDISEFRDLLGSGTLSMEIKDYVLDFTQYPTPKDPENWSSYFCSSDCLHMESIAQKLDDPGILLCTVEHHNNLEHHQGITLNRVNIINDAINGIDRFSGELIVGPGTINELRQGGKVFYFGNMKYHTKMFRLHYVPRGSSSGKYLDTLLTGQQRRSWKNMCLTAFPHLL